MSERVDRSRTGTGAVCLLVESSLTARDSGHMGTGGVPLGGKFQEIFNSPFLLINDSLRVY